MVDYMFTLPWILYLMFMDIIFTITMLYYWFKKKHQRNINNAPMMKRGEKTYSTPSTTHTSRVKY